ncbi:MAG: uroporphyrinogen decarboxylase/cobalamine-independent methonine synthase family protein [Armatimonadota bacterium]
MSGQAQSSIQPVIVTFAATWFNKHFGADFSEKSWSDPVSRTERGRDIERSLFDKFSDVGIGSKAPQPVPMIEAYGNYFSPALFGCEIKYNSNQAPANIPLGHTIEEMRELTVPDFDTNPVIRRALDDARILKKHYGMCYGSINTGSPLNVAVNIYGEEFLMACAAEPETAQHVLRVIAETEFKLYYELSRIIDPEHYPPADITMGYGNCPAIMFSPRTYREVILPVDKWFRNKVTSFPLHHCGVFDDYIDIYKELDPCALDIGGGSNYKAVREAFPDIPFSCIVNAPDVEGKTQGEIDQHIGHIAEDAGPADKISVLWVAEVSQTTSDETVRAIRTAHERI